MFKCLLRYHTKEVAKECNGDEHSCPSKWAAISLVSEKQRAADSRTSALHDCLYQWQHTEVWRWPGGSYIWPIISQPLQWLSTPLRACWNNIIRTCKCWRLPCPLPAHNSESRPHSESDLSSESRSIPEWNILQNKRALQFNAVLQYGFDQIRSAGFDQINVALDRLVHTKCISFGDWFSSTEIKKSNSNMSPWVLGSFIDLWWIKRLVNQSKNKTKKQQLSLNNICLRLGLPLT